MPKFHIGRPPDDQAFVNAGWKSIRTLDHGHLFWSLCIGISIGVGTALIWRNYYGESLPFGSPSWMEISLSLIILIVGHEAIHLLGFPQFGLNSNTLVGIWLEAGSPYVQHTMPMSRNRFLIVLLLPFLFLSVLPFALAYNDIGPINQLSWISVLNCVGAGSDIFISAQILRTVSSRAKVLESGNSLYWQD